MSEDLSRYVQLDEFGKLKMTPEMETYQDLEKDNRALELLEISNKAEIKAINERIQFAKKFLVDISQISDGTHTFAELYAEIERLKNI